MVDAIGIITVGTLALMVFAVLCGVLAGRFLMTGESFKMARAHLYGQSLNQCSANEDFWPKHPRFSVEYQCPSVGEVLGEARFYDIHVWSVHVRL